ncbi:hypothetical protein T310_10122 [Rasamsonia emersonii CBS 393.64]|uniref:Uncharacterized protein n=1 Tax=Rasamsonia emersonii (strain ATCC 16479 / CBS 393.64 / IMI 116815) TaxID=1408163 RepID=A0A0F4YDQ8_RASE3|nr:hypothetical protein T310_10122 [Rasamsonia emersonii CBS 393.64]KKA16294.1 hypothetical protein T310_10122 [Rasamsonia emersonii CBS 393.64]
MERLVRKGPQAHGIQQQAALTAGGAGSPGAGIAVPARSSASGDVASMPALERNLLLLSEDLDLGGGKAKGGIGDGGCDGHLGPGRDMLCYSDEVEKALIDLDPETGDRRQFMMTGEAAAAGTAGEDEAAAVAVGRGEAREGDGEGGRQEEENRSLTGMSTLTAALSPWR